MAMTGQPSADAGGLGQAASDLLKELQKSQTDLQGLENKKASPGGDNFGHMLEANGPKEAQGVQAGQAPQRTALIDVLRQAKAEHVAPSTRVGATEKVQESQLQSMIKELVHGQDKMTKIMNMAMSGRQFQPGELLAMQAGVYSCSQTMDLVSKVVQTASSNVKQVVNTQL